MNHSASRRVLVAALLLAMSSVALLALWRQTFWGPFEPRVLEIAREQFVSGRLLRSPTFSGMPFLEKPPLSFDLLALGFHAAGEPSVLAARLVQGAVLLAWIAAAMAAARTVAGPRAGLLAGCLLVTTPVFFSLAGRVSVDSFLAAALALCILVLSRSLSTGRGEIDRRAWLLGLAAGGVAFLTKGVFGSFLFLGPLLVYMLLVRDWRILRILVRPTSIAVLCLPVLAWGALLYSQGGGTYVFEALLNNSLGRFLHIRFEAAGVGDLPYGGVNSPQVWWYYAGRIGSLAGPATLLLPFAAVWLWKRRARERGPRTRLAVLGLCFAVVPPVLLSFSSQKGVHHLGSSTTGFVLLGALWLNRRLSRFGAAPRLDLAAAAVAFLAPLALVATLFGLPATKPQVIVAAALVGVSAAAVCAAAFRSRAARPALYATLACVMTVVILTRAPGRTGEDDLRFLDFPRWLRSEIGDRPLGWHRLGESDLGAFCWALEREMTKLAAPSDVAAYLAVEEPRIVVVREPVTEFLREQGVVPVVFATGGNGKRVYSVLTNEAGREVLPRPSRAPPFSQ